MTLDPAQRSQLQKAKLAAVTRDFLDQERARSAVAQETVGFLSAEIDVAEVVEAGSLYALNLNGHGFVLLSESSARSLSAAMIWAAQQPAQRLTVFVDAPSPSDARTEELSRWAQYFLLAEQPIEVRVIDGPVSRRVEPGSVPEPCALPERHELLEQHLLAEGLEVVHEHGVTRGEVLGLEVARLVVWPGEAGGDDALHLEVGVGRFDRDAHAAVRPDESPVDDLAHTVSIIRDHRFPGAPSHAVQRLSRERWLRALAVAQPSLVGAETLTAIGMTAEPAGLRDAFPASAVGTATDGSPLILVFSCGVDLGLLPLAADLREQINSEATLRIALPAQDHHVATKWLASMLRRPAELIDIEVGWG
ncbi:unannotated protein [freshwater metagenome]|uniref:Unannotated protein n=1 Tax=freshwater metagenome TaxID=449393 RepID=A0A6J7FJD0_9ZZZZ|nr:hypothetical protein [Actinomycetota bacterium]